MFKDLFSWNPINKDNALHDWLWLLSTTKKKLYINNQKMFELYTEYIEKNDYLIRNHLNELALKVESLDPNKNGKAVISAFVTFHNPYFSKSWNRESYQTDFENLWTLVL
mgnify:CR=1 FL=1